MFFIFGTRSKHLQSKAYPGACSYCQQENSLALLHYLRYFHIFWIPLIPLWKESFSVCTHCKQQLSFRQFSPELKQIALQERKEQKFPYLTFIVPIVLVLAFVSLFVVSLITHR